MRLLKISSLNVTNTNISLADRAVGSASNISSNGNVPMHVFGFAVHLRSPFCLQCTTSETTTHRHTHTCRHTHRKRDSRRTSTMRGVDDRTGAFKSRFPLLLLNPLILLAAHSLVLSPSPPSTKTSLPVFIFAFDSATSSRLNSAATLSSASFLLAFYVLFANTTFLPTAARLVDEEKSPQLLLSRSPLCL